MTRGTGDEGWRPCVWNEPAVLSGASKGEVTCVKVTPLPGAAAQGVDGGQPVHETGLNGAGAAKSDDEFMGCTNAGIA